MQTLTVALGTRSYPIYVGPGLLTRPELIVERLPQKKVAIITNSTVGPLYLEGLRRGLAQRGSAGGMVTPPPGGIHKDWARLNGLLRTPPARPAQRGEPLVA